MVDDSLNQWSVRNQLRHCGFDAMPEWAVVKSESDGEYLYCTLCKQHMDPPHINGQKHFASYHRGIVVDVFLTYDQRDFAVVESGRSARTTLARTRHQTEQTTVP